jgi:hypothetical protein
MSTVRGLATLAGAVAFVLSVFSGVVRGDGEASTIRWDIQHYPNFVLQSGGEAFADAVDGSKIRFTGSGTFKTDGDHVTGGGTWKTFAASGVLTGSAATLGLESRELARGARHATLPGDRRRDRAPAQTPGAGLAVFQIHYSGGGVCGRSSSVATRPWDHRTSSTGVTVLQGSSTTTLPEKPDDDEWDHFSRHPQRRRQ